MDNINKILDFCVNNEKFDTLLSAINEFNPLKILGVHEYEIRHSNVLAWLLNPKAHHGLGDTIFKKIVCEVLKENIDLFAMSNNSLQISDVLTSDYSDIEILREWKNIDILAVSHSKKTVLVVENKYNATESSTQLVKYLKIIQNKYEDYRKLFILLTVDGVAPIGSDEYLVFTHKQIHDIIKSVIEIRKDYINSKVLDFINQYLSILEDKEMTSETLSTLCRSLYKEHREAIELIITYGKPTIPLDRMKEFHCATETTFVHGDDSYNKGTINTYYNFIPQIWKGLVPDTNLYTSDKYLMFFSFIFSEYEKGKVILSLNIGKFPENENRTLFVQKIVEAFTGANKPVKNSKSTKSTTSTRLLSESIDLTRENLEDYDEIVKILIASYNSRFKEAVEIVNPVIQEFWGKN